MRIEWTGRVLAGQAVCGAGKAAIHSWRLLLRHQERVQIHLPAPVFRLLIAMQRAKSAMTGGEFKPPHCTITAKAYCCKTGTRIQCQLHPSNLIRLHPGDATEATSPLAHLYLQVHARPLHALHDMYMYLISCTCKLEHWLDAVNTYARAGAFLGHSIEYYRSCICLAALPRFLFYLSLFAWVFPFAAPAPMSPVLLVYDTP